MFVGPNNTPSDSTVQVSGPRITLLFGVHASAEDVTWRVNQIERAISHHSAAPRHLILLECSIPSTLPSSVRELQSMYNEARTVNATLPRINWHTAIRTGELSESERGILRNFHSAGISQFIERCNLCPDGSHELILRPMWMPISNLVTSLNGRGLSVKCGFELLSLDSYINFLRHANLPEQANLAASNGDLGALCQTLLLENGLRWKSDRVRDNDLANLIQQFLAQNPGAHVIVERGSAHRSNLESALRLEAFIPQVFSQDDNDIRHAEVRSPDFWKDADVAPTPVQLAQALRFITASLAPMYNARFIDADVLRNLEKRLAEVPNASLLEVLQESSEHQLVPIDKIVDFVMKRLNAKGFDILS